MTVARFPWRQTFILGFGFFGISIIWPIFNSLIPPLLQDLGLPAALIGSSHGRSSAVFIALAVISMSRVRLSSPASVAAGLALQ